MTPIVFALNNGFFGVNIGHPVFGIKLRVQVMLRVYVSPTQPQGHELLSARG